MARESLTKEALAGSHRLRDRCAALAALLACALCIAAAGGSPAAGAAPVGALRGSFRSWLYPGSAEVLLHGTDGYQLTIFTLLPAKKFDVYATKGQTQVDYEAPATVTRHRIKASLGALGEIEGTFRPTRTTRTVKVDRRCTGNRPPLFTPRLTRFVGRVAFRGEEGFTAAIGSPDPAPPRVAAECKAFLEAGRVGARGASQVGLLAGGSVSGATTLFSASRAPEVSLWPQAAAPPAPDGSFAAYVVSRSGPVSVERVVQAPAAPGQFSFDESLRSAQVAPPSPFTGSAELVAGEGGGEPSWSGDLAVAMPGLGEVALAGPGFEAKLGTGSELVETSTTGD
jgi:hypothetical protein